MSHMQVAGLLQLPFGWERGQAPWWHHAVIVVLPNLRNNVQEKWLLHAKAALKELGPKCRVLCKVVLEKVLVPMEMPMVDHSPAYSGATRLMWWASNLKGMGFLEDLQCEVIIIIINKQGQKIR
jgi:hypothetical protein